MAKVSVVYHSGGGHTAKMAEAVHQGAASVSGIDAKLISVNPDDIVGGRWKNKEVMNQLNESDAIIFGSPTYMGSVSGQMKAFIDGASEQWYKGGWKNKVAGGFSVSGSPSGDKSNTLNTFFTFAMQMGMIWVGQDLIANKEGINRLGFYSGAAGQAGGEPPEQAPNEADKKTGAHLGQRVAELALKLAKN